MLVRVELAGFQEDLASDLELADVMEKGCAAYGLDLLGGELQAMGQQIRKEGDPVAMTHQGVVLLP